MGIYFKNIIATVIFENDKFSNILQENQFDKEIAAQKMIIIIRDIDQGKAGGGSPHQSSPSLKVKNGNKNDKHHSNDGDPIYFTKKGKPVFGAEEANLNKDEEIYLRNFILHNYLNLYNYWFAPRYCETKEFEKELQHEIQRRIQYNINHIDYRKKGDYTYDPKVEISEKVRQNLMLIHELYNEKYEYIANYDSNGNLIYSKNWDIGKKKYNIDYEYEQRFGPQNRLIYYKNLNDEDDEIYYEYNNNGKLIYKRYWKDQFTKYIYNSNGNLIQEVDENEKILQEYKYDNIQRLISSNNYIYTYLSNNKVLATYNNDTKTILFNPYVNIIEVNRCKYSDEYSIIIFDKNYNIIFALDSNFNILANVMYNSKGLPISSLFYDTYETYTYDDHDKLLRTEVRNNLSGAVEEIIDYENIYEKD